MKRALLLLALVLAPATLPAQQATNNTPIVQPPIHNYRVETFFINRGEGVAPRWEVVLSQRDSGGTEAAPRVSFTGPGPSAPQSGATVVLLCAALDTVVPGEPVNAGLRANYRVLDFLIDHGYLTGVTLQ